MVSDVGVQSLARCRKNILFPTGVLVMLGLRKERNAGETGPRSGENGLGPRKCPPAPSARGRLVAARPAGTTAVSPGPMRAGAPPRCRVGARGLQALAGVQRPPGRPSVSFRCARFVWENRKRFEARSPGTRIRVVYFRVWNGGQALPKVDTIYGELAEKRG